MTIQEAYEILDETTVELSKQKYTREYANEFLNAYNMALEALEKLKDITEVLDDTDFHNEISVNAAGEDKGYHEAICCISLIVDRKERWFYERRPEEGD